MALYHFEVMQISRGRGQTAVASAAYRAGERLHDSYYDENPDYRRKGGVLHSEVILPAHAPRRLSDRETLWNEVESAEKHPRAQLAYSFDVAFQNELSFEENLSLARRFIAENFTARGMIADLACHDPHKDDDIKNPHFHVLCPIRPLNPDGTWGMKQRREYVLDENGERVRDGNGKLVYNAVATTDWGAPETLLAWRENWARLVNEAFEKKGIAERVDHRSYEDRGIDLIPTVHEGPAVRAMEARGIRTDVGDWNRLIRKANALLHSLKGSVKALADWISELRKRIAELKEDERLARLESQTLASVLCGYYERRNAGAYSNKARVNNLKQQARAIDFLHANGISSLGDLDKKVKATYSEVSRACAEVRELDGEVSLIEKTLSLTEKLAKGKPVYDALRGIRRKSDSDAFKELHHAELTSFYAARRELGELYPNGIPDETELRKRLASLREKRQPLYSAYKKLKEEAGAAYAIKKAIQADYEKAMRERGDDKLRKGEER